MKSKPTKYPTSSLTLTENDSNQCQQIDHLVNAYRNETEIFAATVARLIEKGTPYLNLDQVSDCLKLIRSHFQTNLLKLNIKQKEPGKPITLESTASLSIVGGPVAGTDSTYLINPNDLTQTTTFHVDILDLPFINTGNDDNLAKQPNETKAKSQQQAGGPKGPPAVFLASRRPCSSTVPDQQTRAFPNRPKV